MIERSQNRRLDAVARTYLDREGPVPRLAVIAGEDEASTRAASACLQRAAGVIGLPTVALDGGSETVDLELAHDRSAPLVIYHHGAVRERQLRRLRPPEDAGVDLLLWDLGARARVGLRSLYLMGLWAWSLQPRQSRCLVPPTGEDTGAPSLKTVRARVRAGLETAGARRPVEVLQRPGDWTDERTQGLMGQILQSLLAASRRERRGAAQAVGGSAVSAAAGGTSVTDPHASTAPRPATGPQRLWNWTLALCLGWVLGLGVGLGSAAIDAGEAAAASLTVEVRGIDADAPLAVASDGSRVLAGAYHLLRLQPGVGSRLAEGGIAVSTERDDLFARMGEQDLVFDGERQRIEGVLVLHAPEFTLEVRQGAVRAGPEAVVVEPQISGPPLPGRQGLFVSGVMLVIILLLVWRAASVRRKLDQPYKSLRRRARDSHDS